MTRYAYAFAFSLDAYKHIHIIRSNITATFVEKPDEDTIKNFKYS